MGIQNCAITAAVIATLHVAITANASAQSATADSARAAALRAVSLGAAIRVRTAGQSIYSGALVERSDSAIAIQGTETIHRAEVSRVAAIWGRERSAGRGALIGGGVGLVMGALAGAVLGEGFCDAANCHGAALKGAAELAPTGAVIGVVTGAVIGYFIRRWRQLWP